MAFIFIRLLVAVELFRTVRPVFDELDQHNGLIPLIKCCSDQEFYLVGFDECKDAAWSVSSMPDDESLVDNPMVTPALGFSSSSTRNLSVCGPGFHSQTTTDFHLDADGSATILADGSRLEPGEFCVNPIMSDDKTSQLLVVRYCLADRCNKKGAHCVRKCCPMGMVVNESSSFCQRASQRKPWRLVFHDSHSHQVLTSPPDPQSYIIRDGEFPRCPEGNSEILSPQESVDGVHYIFENGQMYVPSYPEHQRTTDEYCVDNFLSDHGIIVQKAVACYSPMTESEDKQLVLTIYPYFLFASSFFLVATFVVYAIIPEIRNIHGVAVMCLVASMAVLYILLGLIQWNSRQNTQFSSEICSYLAVLAHFTFLSTFTWLNAMSFDICWSFSEIRPKHASSRRCKNRQHLGRRIIFYSIYAWGVPFAVVLVGQILDNVDDLPDYVVTPRLNDDVRCWFSDVRSFWVYLYVPTGILIVSNTVFFVCAVVLFQQASKEAALAVDSSRSKQTLRVIFSLFILMGVSWIMEFISVSAGGSAYIWIPTDIFNILTGVFIFAIFVCKPKVWKLLKLKCPCLRRVDQCCSPLPAKRSNTRQQSATIHDDDPK